MRGKYITFEGLDGAGKTTQMQKLANLLEKGGEKILVTREPGGTELGEQARDLVKQKRKEPLDPRTQLFLFAASFAEKWAKVIRPALEDGVTVLSDRGFHSTIAYQSAGGGLEMEEVKRTCLAAFEGNAPDATFFFDLEPAERHRRLSGRGLEMDAIELQGDRYFAKVRDGFLEMAKKGDLVLIDANGSPDEVFENLKDAAAMRGIIPGLENDGIISRISW